MKFFLAFIIIVCLNETCFSQNHLKKGNKFFISNGYGLAGSFFVRSYQEFAPVSDYKVFYNKRFIGSVQDFSVGINLPKNWEARAGINFQHYTRRVKVLDTLNNSVFINFNHDIHHRSYMWFGSISKKIGKKKHYFIFETGLYYLRESAETIEIFSNYVANVEPQFKDSKAEELGSLFSIGYEYKFQPRVHLGIKSQFYYTLTAATAEAISIFPYIKILF